MRGLPKEYRSRVSKRSRYVLFFVAGLLLAIAGLALDLRGVGGPLILGGLLNLIGVILIVLAADGLRETRRRR